MYKDPDRQKEANRQAMERYRAAEKRRKGITNKQGITLPEKTDLGNTLTTTQTVSPNTISPKRGKDIKYFGDLPVDVQASIDRLSVVDGKIDQIIKDRRTEIALAYQRNKKGVMDMIRVGCELGYIPHNYSPDEKASIVQE